MKAISFRQHLPIENPESLIDVTIDAPTPGPRDLLVRVQAVSVNPVDTKIRKGSGPGQPSEAAVAAPQGRRRHALRSR